MSPKQTYFTTIQNHMQQTGYTYKIIYKLLCVDKDIGLVYNVSNI